MRKNTGKFDRTLRIGTAIFLVALYYAGHFTGVTGYALLIAASILLFTGLTGFCPLYLPFGWNTCNNKN